MNDEQRRALAKPFEAHQIRKKPGHGGKPMNYISHALVTERLNEIDPNWTSRVLEIEKYPDERGLPHVAGVLMEYTICGVTRTEGGGPSRPSRYPDELKNALSDALKRAAMRFGVALSMWDSLVDAEDDEDAHPDYTQADASEPSPARRSAPRPVAAPHSPTRPTPTSAAASTPQDAAPAGDGDGGWTDFWFWAKSKGLKGRDDIDKRIGEPTQGMNPAQIRTRLEEVGIR